MHKLNREEKRRKEEEEEKRREEGRRDKKSKVWILVWKLCMEDYDFCME